MDIRFKVDTTSVRPVYEQVKDGIRYLISTGKLPSGNRLPPVRQLSENLGVGYVTVARSIRDLVMEGVLEARTGRGTLVSAQRPRLETIGLVGTASFGQILRETRFAARALLESQDQIIERGKTVVYNHWDAQQPLHELFNHLSLVDGMLLLAKQDTTGQQLREVVKRGKPLVMIGEAKIIKDIPVVHSANDDDAFRVGQTLIQLGHKKVAILFNEEYRKSEGQRARINGLTRALSQLPDGFDERYILHGSPAQQAASLLKLRPRPTALFAPGHVDIVEKVIKLLAGTPMETGKQLYPAVYDDNLFNILSQMQIPYLGIEQAIPRIVSTALTMLTQMIETPEKPLKELRVQIPAKLVSVTEAGEHIPLPDIPKA